MKISIIVPAYNEEKTVERTIVVLLDYLGSNFEDFEIVVVSDGSRDRTFDLARKHRSESVKVFEYLPNRGKGNALKYGFSKTTGGVVVFYDTGINFPPSQIGDFIGLLKKTGAGLVIGSKRHPQSKVDYPFKRRVVSFLGQILVKILFSLDVTDTQVGLKVFRREVLEKVAPLLLVKKYAFDIEVLALARHFNFKIREAPVNLRLRLSTAVSPWSLYKTLFDTLAIFYRLKILRFYDLPEKERRRLLTDYPVTALDRFLVFVLGDVLNRSE